MKLSEQLKQDHECGLFFGHSLLGYAERAQKLEDLVWSSYYSEACKWGATNEKATEYANIRLAKL